MSVHAHLTGFSLGDAHPCDEPGGWPEFQITLTYYVTTHDPSAVEAARQRVFEHVTDTAADDLSTYEYGAARS